MVLVLVNVASNEWVPKGGYVPLAIFASAVLVAFAIRVDRIEPEDLGLGRRHVASGLAWGAVVAAVLVVVMAVGVALPATRGLFRDSRVEALSGWGVLFAAFVRVPLGTVLLEEVAFRGVLPAMLAVRTSRRAAVVVSAVLFGFWHVLPSLGVGRVNPVAADTIGGLPTGVLVGASVLVTAGVGLWFSFLRERSGSLLAPMFNHWASNALGYLFAFAVLHG